MKPHKFFTDRLTGNLTALVAGALLTFAFAPFNLSPLGFICPIFLLMTWLNVTPQRAFQRGFLFGLGLFGTGIYWIFNSIHHFGNMNVFFSLFITGGLIVIVALFPALAGWLLNRFYPLTDRNKLVYAFPACWVLCEWLRSFLFTGFPWLSIGYSQMTSPLRGYAPIVGVYGVSLAVMLSSGLILNGILQPLKKHKIVWRQFKNDFPDWFFLILLWICGACFSLIQWTSPYKNPVQVSLVQGNIPQRLKWSPEEIQPTIKHYKALSANHLDSKIIIWPEGAIPDLLQNSTELIADLFDIARDKDTTFITGIPAAADTGNGYYNAIIVVGSGSGFYMKQRLVPFGEFIPLANYLEGLLGKFDIPMSEFIPGPRRIQPLTVDNLNISAFICYEIAFPEQVRGNSNETTDLLLTVSNDAWFGRSIAQAQHLQMAQMRALELGRPVLFVSNDGITAIIAANGQIQSQVPQYQTMVLTDKVQPYRGKTPWQIDGMDPVILLMAIFLFLGWQRKK